MSKEKKTNTLNKLTKGIIDFSKLLWQCITFKFVLMICAVIIVIFSFSQFKKEIERNIDNNALRTLEDTVSNSIEIIELKINDEFSVLSTLALLYDPNDSATITNPNEKLKLAMQKHDFVDIEMLDADKTFVYGTSEIECDEEFVKKVYKCKNSVSNVITSEDGNKYICLGVPVFEGTENNKSVTGAVICKYDSKKFTELIYDSSFENNTFIAQSDGTLIYKPKSITAKATLFDILNTNINDEKKVKKIEKNIKNGIPNSIKYNPGSHKMFIRYDIVPDSEWFYISIVSVDEINPLTPKVSGAAYRFSIYVGVVFMIYIIIAFALDIRVIKKEKEQEQN